MKAIVLNYSNGSVDIVEFPKKALKSYNGDIESFLCEEIGYNADEIAWMSGVESINFLHGKES